MHTYKHEEVSQLEANQSLSLFLSKIHTQGGEETGSPPQVFQQWVHYEGKTLLSILHGDL